jgi:hypothetical protein
LTIVSGLLTVLCLFIAGLPSLVLAIVALTRTNTDPASCRRLTRIGWIILAVVLVLSLAAVVAVFAFGLESSDMVGTPDPSSV